MAKDLNRRVAQPPALPRRDWVRVLHRRSARWDILFHELAMALLRRYWHTQGSFSSDTLRLDNSELPTVSLFLALAFRRIVATNGVMQANGSRRRSLWDEAAEDLEPLLDEAQRAFRDVLCNYCEITGDGWIRRDHRDLQTLLPRLRETLRQFIASRCRPGGDLFPCLQEPMGDDEGYFPPSRAGKRLEPGGDARMDAYHMENLADDGDDADSLKSKLMDFVRADPLLAPEHSHFIADRLKAQGRQNMTPDEQFDFVYGITSDFVFNPTRQRGLTPIELFLQTHLFLSAQQRSRLLRWKNETVMGLFRILSSGGERMELEDLVVGTRYSVMGSQGEPLKPFVGGSILLARLVPWDQTWRFSGVQRVLGVEPAQLPQLLATLSPLNYRRPTDEADARVLRARELAKLAHAQWLRIFGAEAVVSHSLDEHRQKLAQWYVHLREARCLPDGRTLAEAAASDLKQVMPAAIADMQVEAGSFADLTLLFDVQGGLAILVDYDRVRQALTEDRILTPEERGRVFMYLSAPWIPDWCCRRLPVGARLEQVLREVLGDAEFSLERDWDGLLGHFRPLDHCLPVRPRLWA